MAQLDFSLGTARTQLNFAPAVENFFLARNYRDKQLLKKEEREKDERLSKILKQSVDPRTGKVNFEQAGITSLKEGNLKDYQKFSKIHNSDMVFEQNKIKLAQQKQTAYNNKKTVIADHIARYRNDPDRIAKENLVLKNRLGPLEMSMGRDISQMPRNQIMQNLSGSISEKQFNKDEKTRQDNRAKQLNEEFRTNVLPTIDISRLSEDQNARNMMVKKLKSSKYWDTKLLKDFLKSTKGKPSNVIAQMETFKLKWQEEKKRGGAYKSTQYLAANYGTRMLTSHRQMDDLYSKGFDRTDIKNRAYDLAPNEFVPEERLLIDQAEQNFLNATLRRESGASISPSENTKGEKQYFPRPGDTPRVLAQKSENRLNAVASMKAESGGAWDEILNVKKDLRQDAKVIMSPADKEELKRLRNLYR